MNCLGKGKKGYWIIDERRKNKAGGGTRNGNRLEVDLVDTPLQERKMLELFF